MTCREAREYLFAFLDSELDAHLSIEMQRHLEQCAACAREAEIERGIRRALEQNLGALDAVKQSDAGELEATLHRVTRGAGRPILRAHRRHRALALAGTSAVLAAALFWLARRGTEAAAPDSELAHVLIADFQDFVARDRPLQVISSDPVSVASWLEDQTALRVALPPTQNPATRLVGARKCILRGRAAAFAAYELDGQTASLIALPGSLEDMQAMRRVEQGGHTHWVDRCKGHTVVACKRGEVVYAAVSTLPEDRLLPLMRSAPN